MARTSKHKIDQTVLNPLAEALREDLLARCENFADTMGIDDQQLKQAVFDSLESTWKRGSSTGENGRSEEKAPEKKQQGVQTRIEEQEKKKRYIRVDGDEAIIIRRYAKQLLQQEKKPMSTVAIAHQLEQKIGTPIPQRSMGHILGKMHRDGEIARCKLNPGEGLESPHACRKLRVFWAKPSALIVTVPKSKWIS